MAKAKPKSRARVSHGASQHKPKSPSPSHALIKPDVLSIPEAIEKVLIQGDLSPLQPQERIDYYKRVCSSLGLNPLTMPFSYILFRESDGAPAKLSLYANKSCTEQLRKIHGVSVIPPLRRSRNEDIVTVEADVRDRFGRTDSASGSVPLFRFKDAKRYELTGRDLCNAEMKCETKAKRRATLSICGLAFLDESELDTMQVLGGVTPDGRIFRYAGEEPVPPSRQLNENAAHGHPEGSERAKQADAAIKRVEPADKAIEVEKTSPAVPKAQPVPPMEFKGNVEIDCTVPWPIVRGDLQDIIENLQKLFGAALEWGQDSWWHIAPKQVSEFVDLLSKNGFKVDVKIKTPSKNSAGQKSAMTSPPAEAPVVISGTVERVVPDVKYAVITLATKDGKKPSWKCFDKDISEILRKNLGKLAEVILQSRVSKGVTYTNLIGLKNVAGQEYEDLKVPVIERKDQQAGAKTLF